MIGAALGRSLAPHHGHEDEIHGDQMANQLVHVPVAARGLRSPLIRSDTDDQALDRI
jgi:hypothetical protein